MVSAFGCPPDTSVSDVESLQLVDYIISTNYIPNLIVVTLLLYQLISIQYEMVTIELSWPSLLQ